MSFTTLPGKSHVISTIVMYVSPDPLWKGGTGARRHGDEERGGIWEAGSYTRPLGDRSYFGNGSESAVSKGRASFSVGSKYSERR